MLVYAEIGKSDSESNSVSFIRNEDERDGLHYDFQLDENAVFEKVLEVIIYAEKGYAYAKEVSGSIKKLIAMASREGHFLSDDIRPQSYNISNGLNNIEKDYINEAVIDSFKSDENYSAITDNFSIESFSEFREKKVNQSKKSVEDLFDSLDFGISYDHFRENGHSTVHVSVSEEKDDVITYKHGLSHEQVTEFEEKEEGLLKEWYQNFCSEFEKTFGLQLDDFNRRYEVKKIEEFEEIIVRRRGYELRDLFAYLREMGEGLMMEDIENVKEEKEMRVELAEFFSEKKDERTGFENYNDAIDFPEDFAPFLIQQLLVETFNGERSEALRGIIQGCKEIRELHRDALLLEIESLSSSIMDDNGGEKAAKEGIASKENEINEALNNLGQLLEGIDWAGVRARTKPIYVTEIPKM